MTQHFIGLDLGSHAVKAVVVKQGLRSGEVIRFDAEPTAADDKGNSTSGDIVAAAGRLISRINIPDASIYCCVSGEHVSVHRISLPLSAAKRARDVMAFELDDRLPYAVEDAMFDFVEQKREADAVVYTVACVSAERLRSLVEGLQGVGIDPAEITMSPLCYGPYLEEIGAVSAPSAILDLGHNRTNLVIAGDAVTTARTLLRGGRELTLALSEEGHVDYATAQKYKEQAGLSGKVGEVLRDRMNSLCREIVQTFNGHLANGGQPVQQLLICGGGARMPGLDAHLQEVLGIPVSLYRAPVYRHGVETFDAMLAPELAVLASCLAGTGLVPKTRRFNLRHGAFAWKGDTEGVRRRMILLAACFLGIIGAWIFSSVTHYMAVSAQAEVVRRQLEKETTRVLKEPVTSRTVIEGRMMPKEETRTPIPKRDAFEVLVELSKRIPDSVVHDIEQLEIRQRQVVIRGLVNPAPQEGDAEFDDEEEDLSPTDLIKKELAGFEECFTSFKIPKVQTVEERQRYTMEIDSRCP